MYCKTCVYRDELYLCVYIHPDDCRPFEKEGDKMKLSFDSLESPYVGDNFGCVHHKERK